MAAVLVAGAAEAGSGAPAAGTDPVRRECGSSVWGEPGSDWPASSVIAGPLMFVNARLLKDSTYRFGSVGGGRYKAMKQLVVVRTGWVARVVVPSAQRTRVALQYAPEHFNTAVVPAQSEHDVTFAACPPGRPSLGPSSQRETQFNGGIVVAGRRCVMLAVYAAKQGHPLPSRPVYARISFGAGKCGT